MFHSSIMDRLKWTPSRIFSCICRISANQRKMRFRLQIYFKRERKKKLELKRIEKTNLFFFLLVGHHKSLVIIRFRSIIPFNRWMRQHLESFMRIIRRNKKKLDTKGCRICNVFISSSFFFCDKFQCNLLPQWPSGQLSCIFKFLLVYPWTGV